MLQKHSLKQSRCVQLSTPVPISQQNAFFSFSPSMPLPSHCLPPINLLFLSSPLCLLFLLSPFLSNSFSLSFSFLCFLFFTLSHFQPFVSLPYNLSLFCVSLNFLYAPFYFCPLFQSFSFTLLSLTSSLFLVHAFSPLCPLSSLLFGAWTATWI